MNTSFAFAPSRALGGAILSVVSGMTGPAVEQAPGMRHAAPKRAMTSDRRTPSGPELCEFMAPRLSPVRPYGKNHAHHGQDPEVERTIGDKEKGPETSADSLFCRPLDDGLLGQRRLVLEEKLAVLGQRPEVVGDNGL
jgi:hypothetical protein